MNTLKWLRIFLALVCLTLMLEMTIGNVLAGSTLPAESDFAAIDAYVSQQMKALGIPGLALGIVGGDQIAHLQGFGAADSSGQAVTLQTPFHIGSVTKPFTALAVMQLVEKGKIDLDAPVQTYLPWFKLADPEVSTKITVRSLLNQTTGISEFDARFLSRARERPGHYRDPWDRLEHHLHSPVFEDADWIRTVQHRAGHARPPGNEERPNLAFVGAPATCPGDGGS